MVIVKNSNESNMNNKVGSVTISQFFKIKKDYWRQADNGNITRAYKRIRSILNKEANRNNVGIQQVSDLIRMFMFVFMITDKHDILDKISDYYLDECAWMDVYEIHNYESEMLAESLAEDDRSPFNQEVSEVDKGWAESETLPIILTNEIDFKKNNQDCNGSCFPSGDCTCGYQEQYNARNREAALIEACPNGYPNSWDSMVDDSEVYVD